MEVEVTNDFHVDKVVFTSLFAEMLGAREEVILIVEKVPVVSTEVEKREGD